MRDIKIGLIGLGTVGTGVAKTLTHNHELLCQRLGFGISIKKVAVANLNKKREVEFADGVLTNDIDAVINDPEIEIIVELVGGIEPAKSITLKALKAGKHVVTANKALLAEQGREIFDAAQSCGRDLYFEGAVGGGIPIIKTLREALVANNFAFVYGIMNGTCNYILTQMSENGTNFDATLKAAMELGYAEADPALDIDGIDAAHKLAIIASLAYGVAPDMSAIHIEGIRGLDVSDIQFASELGYKVKLLCMAIGRDDKVEVRVQPTLIPHGYLLAKVDDVFNAFYVKGDIVGPSMYYGRGAGMLPTASAVVSDICDVARNINAGVAGRIPHLGYRKDQAERKRYMPIEEIVTNYYLRLNVQDKPGVMARITGILGERNISILSMIQKSGNIDGFVPIVMLTHEAKEADLQAALDEMAALDAIKSRPVLLRVEDRNLKEQHS